MTRVFISSTYLDLQDYREAANKACLELDMQPIGMEQFEAMDKGATAASKFQLDRADVYIGIFAYRYGYIEPPHTQSVTEIEFDYAKEHGIERLCFIADDSYGFPHRGEDTHNRDKLDAFKKRVMDQMVIKTFGEVSDFKAKVLQALIKWKERQEKPADAPSAGATSAIFAQAASAITDRAEKLIGREALQQQVTDLLDKGERVLVCGFGGMGKTALAAEIAAEWIAAGKGAALWVKAGSAPADALFEALVRPFGAAQAIAGAAEAQKPRILSQIIEQARITLLVIDDAWEEKALAVVTKGIPRGIPALITARQRYPIRQLIGIIELSDEKALETLGFYANQDFATDQGAKDLCDLLGNHAYALEIAGKTLLADDLKPQALYTQIKDAPFAMTMPLSFAEEGRENIGKLLEFSLNVLNDSAKNVFLAFGAFFAPRLTAEILMRYFVGKPEVTPEIIVQVRATNPQVTELADEELIPLIQQAITQNIDPAPAQKALTELIQRGLTQRINPTENSVESYLIHDLAYSYAKAHAQQEQKARALDACLAYMERYNTPSLANFAALRPELDNFMGASQWAMEAGKYAAVERFDWDLYNGSAFLDYQGFYTQTITLLERAAAAAKHQGNRRHQSAHLGNLGLAYHDLGQVQQAIDYHNQALDIYREIGNEQGEGKTLGNLGIAYHGLGQVQKAIEYYEQSSAILHEIGDQPGQGNILGNLGTAYRELGQVQKAIDYYEQSLAIAREIGDQHEQANNFGDLGNTYRELGQVQKAIEYHNEALDIDRKTGNRKGVAEDLNNLGVVYEFSLQELSKALDHYQQARQIRLDLNLMHLVEKVDKNIARVQAKIAGTWQEPKAEEEEPEKPKKKRQRKKKDAE